MKNDTLSSAPLLVDNVEAARMLGVSPRKVRAMRSTGELPAVKIGKRALWRVADIAAFVEGLK